MAQHKPSLLYLTLTHFEVRKGGEGGREGSSEGVHVVDTHDEQAKTQHVRREGGRGRGTENESRGKGKSRFASHVSHPSILTTHHTLTEIGAGRRYLISSDLGPIFSAAVVELRILGFALHVWRLCCCRLLEGVSEGGRIREGGEEGECRG